MEPIVTGLAQGQQIGLVITAILTAKDEVMDFQPLVFRLPLALLTGIPISREHIGAGVSIAVVDPCW